MAGPLDDIENAKAQHDIGVMAFRIFRGAREEGATKFEAFLIVVAFCRGLIGANDDKEEDEEEKP
jgi:hypothetical protein